MKRFSGLLKDTWWLWIVLLTAGLILTIFVHFIFFVTFPISLFSFVYFGLVRYDEDGSLRRM